MQMQQRCLRAFAFVAGVAVLTCSSFASADPSSRVARLGYMTGAVSFSPAGENDWVQAAINRPLTTGDRLWADARARAEIQVGGAMIRMHAGTSVSILNLDDRIAQLQLTQGVLNVRVRRLEPDQVFEVDTPNLAFTLRQPGEYRIEVDPDGSATTIVVRKGQGEVYGEGAAYVIDSRQPYRFTGTGLREYQYVDAPRPDEFDRWSSDRDRRYDSSISARYVSEYVVGYQDLDANGTWRVDANYGNVWVPTHVAAGWAPYRDGHWAWVDPWGWTWVDDAPWGFAVSHYGRWTNLSGTWGWVPGPVRSRAYYAPALVAFVGGSNFQLAVSGGNVGGVAWFPLGPREVYRPSYAVSRGYFENINVSNTVVNTTVINNYYTNTNVTNVVYANRQVPGAVVAVPTTAFVQSQPVARAAVQVTQQVVTSAPVAIVPAVAPTERSVRGAAGPGDKPPALVFERPVVARSAPPAALSGFAAQQQQLAAKPGKPLDDAARKELKPAAAAVPVPVVKVVAPAQIAAPTAAPPPAAPAGKAAEGRGKSDDRKSPGAPGLSGAPSALPPTPMPGTAPAPIAAPQGAPSALPPGSAPAPGAPPKVAPPAVPPGAAPTPAAPPKLAPPAPPSSGAPTPVAPTKVVPSAPGAVPAPATPPQVAPPAPTAKPTEPPGKDEKGGKGEKRGQPVAPPPNPQGVVQPQVAPPQSSPPVPATQPSPPRPAEPKAVPPQIAPPAPAAASPPPRPAEPKAVPQQLVPPAPAPQPRPAEPKAVPPQMAPPAPAPQSPAPQRPVEPRINPTPQVAPPAPPSQQPAPRPKPEPVPAEKVGEPRPPVAAPKPPQPAQGQPAPKVEPSGQEPKPASSKQEDKKKSDEQKKREEEERKQKG